MRRNSINLSVHNLQKVNQILSHIHSFEFNIFELDQLTEKYTLKYMTYEIFQRFNFFEKNIVSESKFDKFMNVLIDGYDRNIPYHNDLHAGDILQTTYMMIDNEKLFNILSLKDIDILALLLASASHDFKHPGKNNIYQINAKTNLALAYNGE
jgi:cAMP-specific phosphodiesterase 4